MPSLLLIRHAIAEPRGTAWPDDAERPLSVKGAARMREIAARLQAVGERADLVVSSPLRRAVQTAEILAEAWAPAPLVVILDELAPGGAPTALAEALRVCEGRARAAVVGHEPDLGAFASWLVGARTALPFKKGGAARIDVSSWPPLAPGQLMWLATPRLLRRG